MPLCGLTCKKVFERIHFRLNSKLTQTPPRPPPESFKLPSKHPPDSFQTHSRHHTDALQTFQTPLRNLQLHFLTTKSCCSQISSNPSGGWVVVVYRYIIMPLCGPTCKKVLARIQFRLDSELYPSVAITNVTSLSRVVPSSLNR